MSDFKAKITADLDVSKAEQQLEQFGKNKKVKIEVDAGNGKTNIENINSSIKTTQKSAQSLGDTLKQALGVGSSYAIAAKGIQEIENAAKKASSAIKEFDADITNIRLATGQSYSSARELVSTYNQMGQSLGATTTEVSNSAVTWLRQGKSIKEANTLIHDSMVLSKVGMLDSAQSATLLTSAMKGYNVSVQDASKIVDKLTSIDANAAVNAGALAEAMSKTAVTANNAGVSMDKLLGYLAVIGETTQDDMSSIGTSLKTIFTRMNDVKGGKLKLIDADGTEELLSDVELMLKNVGIDLRDTVNEFNNSGDVLDSLAAKWNSFSNVQQAALAKAFAGTRQGEKFRILMENYSNATKYMDIAADSAGNAEKKFAAHADSIEAKQKTMQAAFESLATNTFSTDLMSGLVDAGTALIQFIDKTNLLKGALAGVTVAGLTQGLSALVGLVSDAAIKFDNFNSALKLLKAGKIDDAGIKALASATANLSTAQLQAVLSSEALSTSQRMAILTAQGMSESEAQAALASMGLASAEGTATVATFTLEGAVQGLWATLAANPLILVVAGIAASVAAYSTYNQKIEEARQKTQESANAYSDSAQSVNDYVEKIQELRDKLDSGTLSEAEALEAKKQLYDIQSQLQTQYGESAAGIDLVNGSLRDQISLVKELSASDAEEFLTKNLDGIKKAEKEMTKTLGGDGGWFTEAGRVLGTFYNNGSDESNRIKSIAKKYKDNIQLDDMQDGTFRVRFVGDATQAESVLVDFMTDLRHAQDEFGETDALTGLFDGADVVLKEADKIIDKYKDIYETAKQARLISESYGDDKKEYTTNGKTETAVQWLEDYTNSIEKYNDALRSGDVSQITAARNEFEALDMMIQALLKDEDFAQYADMFSEIRDQLDEASITAQEFSNELTGNNLDDQTKSLKEYVEQLKELNMTDTQFADAVLSSLGENGKEVPEAIRQIVDAYAELYGLDASALKPEQIDSIAASLVGNGVLIKEAVEETATSVQTSFGELSGTLDDFEVILVDKKDDNAFRTKMDGYIEKLDALKDAIDKVDSGEQLDQSTVVSLMEQFPQLTQGAGRLEDKLKPLSRQLLGVGSSASNSSSLMGLLNEAIDHLLEADSSDAANALLAVRDGLFDLYNVDRVGDPLDALKSSLKEVQTLQSALSEQKSNGYISSDTIKNLIATNAGYVDALQNTAHGMVVDTQKANELANVQQQLALDIADANKAASVMSYQKNYDEMVKLAGSAEELNRILAERPEGFEEIYALDSANNSLREQIANWESISAEIRGAMSLLSQYNAAQSSANASDNYNTVRGGLKNADELYKQGAITRDDFTSYALLIAKNGATIEEAVTEYADNRERMKRYLETETEKEGLDNFFTDAAKKCEELGTSWVKMNEETGTFEFNIDDMNAFADSMDINTELAENFLLALKDYGYLDLDLSMIGDSFRESVESIDTSSADAEKSIQGIINRMGELAQAGVDVSSSVEPLENALRELSANGIDVSGFVEQLNEIGATQGWHIDIDVDADTTPYESKKEQIQQERLEDKMLDVDANTSTYESKKEQIQQERVEGKTVDFKANTSEVDNAADNAAKETTKKVKVVADPSEIEVSVKDATVTVTQDGELIADVEPVVVEVAQDGTLSVDVDPVKVPLTQDGTLEATVNPATCEISQEGTTEATIEDGKVVITQDGEVIATVEPATTVISQDGTTEAVVDDASVFITQDGTTQATIEDGKVVITQDGEIIATVNPTTVDVTPSENPLNVDVKPIVVDSDFVGPLLLGTVVLDSSSVDSYQPNNKEATAKYNVDSSAPDNYEPKDKEATVKYNKNSGIPDGYKPANKNATVYYRANTSGLPNTFAPITRAVNYVATGQTRYEGTAHAHADGTTRPAYSSGVNWGLPHDEVALVNEVKKPESIVRNGRWSIIPGGAHFAHLKKGDIIFSGEQTEELIKSGKVSSGGGHGEIALADGTAKDGIPAHYNSTATGGNKVITVKPLNNTGSGKTGSSSGKSSSGSGSSSGKKSSNSSNDKEPEKIDWIEVAIDRAERAINHLKKLADSTFKSFSSRNKNLGKEINKVTAEIDLQTKAQARYKKEANSVGLSADLAKKVREGTIDISKYGEETQKLIQEYKQWYDKSLDCKDAIDDLKDTLDELTKQKFDLIISKWDGSLQKLQHTAEELQSLINRRTDYASEYVEMGVSRDTSAVNIGDYQSLVKNATQQRDKRLSELGELYDELNSNKVTKNTEAYNEMLQQIYDVENEIDNLNSSIIEYSNNISAEYRSIFDSISEEYSNKLSLIEHTSNEINTALDTAEEKGYLAAAEYYESLKKLENKNISSLMKEREDLQSTFYKAISSGEIQAGSKAYYEMQQEINSVTEALQESELEVVKLENSIRQAEWDNFDFLEERISRITSEAGFLIDLMKNQDLYTDNGQFTDEGTATLGLRGVNYNVLMKQADDYAAEILKLNKEIAKDPANTELIERREELYDLQQKSIKAAEDEKQAIKGLVKDGIDKELSSLQKLIKSYTEALDSAKDLHDYQKDIAKQTQEIAKLEKQLTAYRGDTSEETKAQVQKIKLELEERRNDLEETEYDHLITEQKKLLDGLYTDYETTLNTRLDNVDALVSDMIDQININASGINDTLNSVTDKVGYTMTSEMSNLWRNAANKMDASNEMRQSQTEQLLSQLVANGAISQNDANRILTALGSGDAQGIQNALNVITQLQSNGTITENQADLIRQSVSHMGTDFSATNNQNRVEQTQKMLDQMVKNGTISEADARLIIQALGSGDAQGILNATNIIDKLTDEGKLSGTQRDDLKRQIHDSGEEYKGVVTNYGEHFSSKLTSTNTSLASINAYVAAIQQKAQADAEAAIAKAQKEAQEAAAKLKAAEDAAKKAKENTKPVAQAATTNTQKEEVKKVAENKAKTDAKTNNDKNKATTKTTTTKSNSTQGDGKVNVGDKVKFVSGRYYADSYGGGNSGNYYLGKQVYITKINSKGSKPYHISTGTKLGSGDLGWLTKSQISGYASGLRSAKSDEDAWVNELGNESIVSPTNRAIITHINKGDSVLDADATRNIWAMANDPTDFIGRNYHRMPDATDTVGSKMAEISQNINFDEMVLPNVTNYKEFLEAMQKDKKFERFMTDMIVAPMLGKPKNLKYRTNF